MEIQMLSVIGLFLVILIAMVMGHDGVVGYSSSSRSLSEYPYEGFESIQNAFERRYGEAFSGEKKEGFGSVQNAFEKRYGEAFSGQKKEGVDSVKNVLEKGFGGVFGREKKEGFESSESPPLKVTGFSGLMSGAYKDEKIIGFMYNNESGVNCKPYGYTNSKGNICLSDSDIRLLTTRGGNASGASDQIGK